MLNTCYRNEYSQPGDLFLCVCGDVHKMAAGAVDVDVPTLAQRGRGGADKGWSTETGKRHTTVRRR